MKRIKFLFAAALCASVFVACDTKDNSSDGTARLQVRLTDDPADYDEVNVDIREVQVNFDGDTINGWRTLNGIKPGIYNLLDLVNDKDTLLADAVIPTGRIHQIRLVLGDNNSVVLDGVSHPLNTPSAQQSGLKLNVQQDIQNGLLYVILLDFDAGRSVNQTGNNNFILKPVIRMALQAVGGSIKGIVDPASSRTSIFALQGLDTIAGTSTDTSGAFLIKGLAAGNYDLTLVPSDTLLQVKNIPSVGVTSGQVTNVDTIHLK
jgi:hypothetical protein